VQSFISVSSSNAEEQELLHLRVADVCQDVPVLETIRRFYKNKYIHNYSTCQKSCCNVFQVHKQARSEIKVFEPSVWTCIKKWKSQLPLNIVGYQEKNLFQLRNVTQDGMETSSTSSSEVESIQNDVYGSIQNDVYRDNSLITVNDTLLSIGQSPVKLQSLATSKIL